MKSVLFFFLFLLSAFSFGQGFKFVYNGRMKPVITKSTLSKATVLGEVMPDAWRNLGLPYRERVEMEFLLDFFPEENFKNFFEIITVELTVNTGGEEKVVVGGNEFLTKEQKAVLKTVEVGTKLGVRIKFKRKKNKGENTDGYLHIAYYSVAVIPEKEALYPGGFEAFSDYVQENVIRKIADDVDLMKALPSFISFTINEGGGMEGVTLDRPGGAAVFPKVDEVIYRAFNKMPFWQAAENSSGLKIKQSFSIPFRAYGC